MHDKKSKYGVFAVGLALLVGVINFWSIRYNTTDDMILALSDYQFWMDTAVAQGRIKMYLSGLLAMIPHALSDIHYLSAVRIVAWLVLIISASAFLAISMRSKGVFAIGVITLSLLWSNSIGGHNMLVSYPFYVPIIASFFVGYLILYTLGARACSGRMILASAILLFLSLLIGGELYFQYVPLVALYFLFYLYVSGNKKDFAYKNVSILVAIMLPIAITIIFRQMHPSQYDGNTGISLDLPRLAKTYSTLTTGLFPGIQAAGNFDFIFEDRERVIISAILALLATVFLWSARSTLLRSEYSRPACIEKIFALAAILLAVLLPNILVSLTVKYQGWVKDGAGSYLYSSLSYIPIALLISIALHALAKNRVAYFVLSIIIGILIFATQLNNQFVGGVQRSASAKWDIFESAVLSTRSSVNSSQAIGISSSFFKGTPKGNYWEQYAKFAFGFNGAVVEEDASGIYIAFHQSYENGGFALSGTKQNVSGVIIPRKCNRFTPCYLLSRDNNSANLIEPQTENEVKKTALDKGYVLGRTYVYTLPRVIPRDHILGLSFLDVDSLSASIPPVLFKTGVDGLEIGNGESWRWARTPAEILIASGKEQSANISLGLTAVEDMKINFYLNGKKTTAVFAKDERKKIELQGIFYAGQNTLSITTDVPPIRLNQADPRLFSFRITSIILNEDEK